MKVAAPIIITLAALGLVAAAGVKLAPETSHVMLCGNPQMLKDVTAVLQQRGMRKHRRRLAGHITVESFW